MDYINRPRALYFCAALCFSILAYFVLGARRKEIIKPKLTWIQPTPAAAMAPRLPSPEKEHPDKGLSKSPTYVKAFPPSQRAALPALVDSLTDVQRKALEDFAFDESQARTSLLGYEEDYRLAKDDKYSYAGFSVGEIKALGDFPDYATLSGVPLPRPYKDFDYTTAMFRPYRPFRWAYHQTMC